jgi:2,3-dihydroxyphenylpropionate 1,2-dioxygenase
MLTDVEHTQGTIFRREMLRAREFVAEFAPDVIVFFGPEHRRTLTDVVPPFTVATSARGYGDFGTSSDPYSVPGDLARELVEALYEAGFDVAHGNGLRLDHGFSLTWADFFGTLTAGAILPIVINCVNAPVPSPARSIELGRKVGQFFNAREEKVLFMGSGGLSHDPQALTAENASLPEAERVKRTLDHIEEMGRRINSPWDRAVLAALAGPDWPELERLSGDEEIASAGVGANEIRTWLAALAAADTGAAQTAYEPVPVWITGMGIAYGRRNDTAAAHQGGPIPPSRNRV